MPESKANGVTIYYEVSGNADNKPVLLLPGVGQQMTRWSGSLVDHLVTAGFRVIRMDNRDAGLAGTNAPDTYPDIAALVQAKMAGQPLDVPYHLRDMADDAAALLTDLDITAAHVVGMSMGGMIAQLLAIHHPDRVLSLTSIMSTTANPALPRAKPEAQAVLGGRRISPMDDREAYLTQSVANARILGSPAYPEPEAEIRAKSAIDVDRAYRPDGFLRQYAAIIAAENRRPLLAQLSVPALVIHGTDDPLVPVEAGRDTAASIPGARMLEIPGMGHNIPAALEATISVAIAELASPVPA